MTHRRTLLAAVVACALALALPAAAPAATAAVTGDDGAAVPLTGPVTVRTMAPRVLVGLEPGEARYEVTVAGPDGRRVDGGSGCRPAGEAAPEPVAYAGNGTYTVRVRTTRDPGDAACAGAGEPLVATFAIAAYTAVLPPQGVLLTRRPLEYRLIPHAFGIDVNPGARSLELRWGRDLAVGPDGGLGDEAARAGVDLAAGRSTVTFARPGTYTFVARATASGEASPWSAPATVRVLSPFDFNGEPSFSDARGPRYRILGDVREPTARGRIAVAVRRARSGRWRGLGKARIRPGGRFAVRFTVRGSGRYELRYRFAGSATTAPGEVVQGIRVTRGRS